MSPIDDLTSDVITVLHHKAKALAAYDKYMNDAEADGDDELRELFSSMRQQDDQVVLQLKEILSQRLADDLGYEEEDDEEEDDDEEDDDTDFEDAAADDEREDPALAGADEIDPVHRAESSPRHR
jgi:hypothetical protein